MSIRTLSLEHEETSRRCDRFLVALLTVAGISGGVTTPFLHFETSPIKFIIIEVLLFFFWIRCLWETRRIRGRIQRLELNRNAREVDY
jgi:hypothetical protein